MKGSSNMVKTSQHIESAAEDFLAELTSAAYSVTLKHGLQGPFIDIELNLWRELRGVVRRQWELIGADVAGRREEALSCRR